MYEVVLLSLEEASDACGTGGGCCAGSAGAGAAPAAPAGDQAAPTGDHAAPVDDSPAAEPTPTAPPPAEPARRAAPCGPRVPVLACADALTAAGARVETVTACSDEDIDGVIARLDAPARPDGLAWPDPDSKIRLVVATATDAQLRAVMRRLVRRYAPPPSRRPPELATNRTVPDLPPIGLLPLDRTNSTDLAAQLGLPRDPAAVAAAVLAGRVRRLDLLRNDGGSVTLDGALLGGSDENGKAVPWRGRVEVDDAVLSDGTDPLLACVVGNAGGYATFDGVPLLTNGDPTDGRVEVAVAVPVVVKRRFRRPRVRIEVRRSRGRAAAVLPRDGEVQFLDDGVAGRLSRKRSWWTEPGAWAVYAQ